MRILIVEDQQNMVDFLQRGLKEQGYSSQAMSGTNQSLIASYT